MDEMQELITETREFVTDFKTRIAGTIAKHTDEIAVLKQRAYRVGATTTTDAHAAAEPMLRASKELQTWLTSARGKKSALTIQFPFEMKAATPITGIGGTVHMPGIAGPQVPALRLAELLNNVPLSMGAAVEYTQETGYTPGAAVVPEGTLKPASALTFVNKLAQIKTIASILKVSVQALMDVPTLQQWLDARLRQAVMLAAEDLFLNAAAPDGLLASAVPLDPAYAPGTGATPLDVIGGAIGQLQAQGYTPDGIVVSGTDANKMRLLKTSYGEYLWASPDSALGVAAIWSIPVVVSPKIASGTFLVGAFGESTLLFVRQLLVVEISFENEDDFVHNLACLRAEERCGLAIPVPAGLVKGTLPASAIASETHAKK